MSNFFLARTIFIMHLPNVEKFIAFFLFSSDSFHFRPIIKYENAFGVDSLKSAFQSH